MSKLTNTELKGTAGHSHKNLETIQPAHISFKNKTKSQNIQGAHL